MNPTETIPALTRWTNSALIGLFMTLLWLPMMDTLFHFDSTSSRSEYRRMAEWPELPRAGMICGLMRPVWKLIITTILAAADA